ncbi:Pth4 protein [Starmerella bacillaris]|uniref:Pth4 protein n=1 Tax=Starmerella bacillaris TaxID=1247836 RepID=A0AAV5RM85_STABA|nr:Pth4 protein [Starmerella bacillaris]
MQAILRKIPRNVFIHQFSRSGKPGGQNVNKLNTKASIRLQKLVLNEADWIPPLVKPHIQDPNFKYQTKSGDLLITSELTRSQHHNLEDCYRKLAQEIQKLVVETEPKESSKEAIAKWKTIEKTMKINKIKKKKLHSNKKEDRRDSF